MESYFPYLQQFAASLSVASCDAAAGGEDDCRDDTAALQLKIVAVVTILVAGAAGVSIPLVSRMWAGARGSSSGAGGVFLLTKAFAAGVILATGFVHMMQNAEDMFSDPCLPATPWRRFPFAGFIAMLASLGTLVVDFLGTQFYERKQREEAAGASDDARDETTALLEDGGITGTLNGGYHDHEGSNIVHSLGGSVHHSLHGHSHGHDHDNEEGPSEARQVVVSQILELGIVSHSVIIGLSLGVSLSPCTIMPLVAALSFHQFFEGFALGDCISQARFRNFSVLLMAFFFAITTPVGIVVGAGMVSFYNPNSPRALVVEGILDSMSAGILIYMALVDLIAADFLGRRMSCSPAGLQVGSYIALFVGGIAMSSLAIWT